MSCKKGTIRCTNAEMESFECAQAKSDALPVVIGISVEEEEDLDDLIPEPKSARVGNLVDHFSYGTPSSSSYSPSSSTGSMRRHTNTIDVVFLVLVGLVENIW